MRTLLRLTVILTLAGLCFIPTVDAAPPDPIRSGDLLVANHQTQMQRQPGVVKIDPVTGDQTVLSKGGLFGQPNDVVVGPFGELYVADSSAQEVGAVLSVPLPSKKQTVVTSGGLMGLPEGIAIEADSQLLVAAFGPPANAIVRVDPETGAQSYVTVLPGQAARVAVESTGQILVGMVSTPPGGQILRVDPVTGAQSIVSAGGLITQAWDLGLASNGDIIVLNRYPNRVLRVDPVSGAQSVISSGGMLVTPSGIAVASNDDIFVVDPGQSGQPDGLVIRIDPVTGAQTIFSAGHKLLDPLGISVVP